MEEKNLFCFLLEHIQKKYGCKTETFDDEKSIIDVSEDFLKRLITVMLENGDEIKKEYNIDVRETIDDLSRYIKVYLSPMQADILLFDVLNRNLCEGFMYTEFEQELLDKANKNFGSNICYIMDLVFSS